MGNEEHSHRLRTDRLPLREDTYPHRRSHLSPGEPPRVHAPAEAPLCPAVDGLTVYVTSVGFAAVCEGDRMESDPGVVVRIEQTV